MNYLLKVKQFTIDSMIAYEELAAEIRDEYYKLLIMIGENKFTEFENRKYYLKIQKIISNFQKVRS